MNMDFTIYSDFPHELTTEWNALLEQSSSHVPFLRSEYLADWWATRGGGEWPDDSSLTLISAREGGRLIGIAPLFIAEHEGKKQLLLLGSIEISDYLDFICREDDLERFISGLLGFIKTHIIDSGLAAGIDLYNIVESSPTLALLEEQAEALNLHFDIRKLQHSPFIPLPETWEAYLNNLDKKQRHEIRRKMRRASEGETQLNLYFTADAGRLEDDMEDFFELMAQDEAKEDFLSPLMREQMKSVMRCAFHEDCLQLAFLETNGRKVAAYMSFDFLKRIWVYNSGLDRDYMEYSPGWVLLGLLLQWAIENQRQEFDFMRGDEDYKYKFGAVDRFVMRVTIGF